MGKNDEGTTNSSSPTVEDGGVDEDVTRRNKGNDRLKLGLSQGGVQRDEGESDDVGDE